MTADRFFLLAFLLTSGCQFSSENSPPRPNDLRARLAERIQSPQDAQLTLTRRPDGSTRALNSHHFTRGEHDVLPMLTRPHSRRLPLIRCRVNGRANDALIDTGSTRSLMDFSSALRTHVVPVHPPEQDLETDQKFFIEPIQRLSGRIDSIFSMASTMTFGEFHMKTLPFYILDDPSGITGQGEEGRFQIEMLIGFDVVKQFASVTFDYRQENVTFSRTREDVLLPNAFTAPLFVRFGLPVVPANFADKPVLAVIDTGGDFAIWVPRSAAEKLNLPPDPSVKGLNRGNRAGGSPLVRSAGNHPIDLGGLSIPPSPVTVSLQPEDGPEAPVIFIGHRILRTFRVTLDLSGGRLLLEPQA
jgi:hypothetical protein